MSDKEMDRKRKEKGEIEPWQSGKEPASAVSDPAS